MKRIAATIAVLIIALAVLDVLSAALCSSTGLPDRVVDIQHPTTLVAKLDHLRMAPHPKVVLLGDSLVYGGILEDFGDADWREHELGTQLTNELGGSTFVMNLGINGALPLDLEALVSLVAACDVDWIVFDMHLRPFSADFSAPAQQMSRPWLRELQTDGSGQAHWRPARSDTSRWLTGRLADGSFLVRNRMLIQENLLSTKPARQPRLRPSVAKSETDAEIEGLMRLAQLKNRLRKLDLSPDDPQAGALQRTLRNLADRRQKHVVFYAKENPALLPDVMEPDDHARQYDRLVKLVDDAQGPSGVYLLPIPDLEERHFVDFTHLNAEGYRILARHLAATIRPAK
ncbi:MAG TPA: hypothetical protein VHR66_24535 [Gemmataceae bacterium]|jgi:hypothetical protein|nr:hypothetical protein [Gemmataceae bacterium]